MNVSLTKEFESYVNDKVASGLYQTASEVIRDGLRLMKARDELHLSKLAQLKRDITLGVEQADQGLVHTFDEETVARIKERGLKKLCTSGEADPG